MLQILRRFGWTWVGLVISDDDYGRHTAHSFKSGLAKSGGGCLAYLEVLPWGHDVAEIQRIVGRMKKSTSSVVTVFAHPSNMLDLMEEHMPYMKICSVFQGVGLSKGKAVPVCRD
ncbi:unnamed protein product [Arctogadus glacialis]